MPPKKKTRTVGRHARYANLLVGSQEFGDADTYRVSRKV